MNDLEGFHIKRTLISADMNDCMTLIVDVIAGHIGSMDNGFYKILQEKVREEAEKIEKYVNSHTLITCITCGKPESASLPKDSPTGVPLCVDCRLGNLEEETGGSIVNEPTESEAVEE